MRDRRRPAVGTMALMALYLGRFRMKAMGYADRASKSLVIGVGS